VHATDEAQPLTAAHGRKGHKARVASYRSLWVRHPSERRKSPPCKRRNARPATSEYPINVVAIPSIHTIKAFLAHRSRSCIEHPGSVAAFWPPSL